MLNKDKLQETALAKAIKNQQYFCALEMVKKTDIQNMLNSWEDITSVFSINHLYQSYSYFSVEKISEQAASNYFFIYVVAKWQVIANNSNDDITIEKVIEKTPENIRNGFRDLTSARKEIEDLRDIYIENKDIKKILDFINSKKSVRSAGQPRMK